MKSIEDACKDVKIGSTCLDSEHKLIRQKSEQFVTSAQKSRVEHECSLNENNCPNLCVISESSTLSQSKRVLTERVGDWVCLNCNNLNFSFRDFCNRCELDRQFNGKTITSAEELASLQQAPINTKEQFNILSELAMSKNSQSALVVPSRLNKGSVAFKP